MDGYIMSVEQGRNGLWSLKICDGEGNLYRYFASVTRDRDLLLKIKEYFDRGDVSPLHIDDIVIDIICMEK